jgi:cyclophilin family peptidyl-prolyl cis-trans isomerase
VATPWLDGKHTIFDIGNGMDVVNLIDQKNDTMKKVTIIRKGKLQKSLMMSRYFMTISQ